MSRIPRVAPPRKRARSLIVPLLIAMAVLTVIIAGRADVAADSVWWERYDVDLRLREDGVILVSERQEIWFDGGPFSGAFADLPLERVSAIEAIAVYEEVDGRLVPYDFVSRAAYDEDPGTYTTIPSASRIELNWGYSEAVDERRVFVIEYELHGAVRVYEDDEGTWEQIWFTAISSEVTDIAPVREASVTLALPEPADSSRVQVGADADDDPLRFTEDFQTWTWRESGLRAGDELEIRIEFPAMTSATPPIWQQEDDQRRFEEEQSADRQALRDVLSLGAGLLVAVLGGVALFGLWYGRGRDPHVGPVAAFLPDPPDDLPPGAVGTLLDEVAHERDIVATMVDLGRRGVITIEESIEAGGRDFKVTLNDPETAPRPFEDTLLSSLFGTSREAGKTALLSQANPLFDPYADLVGDALYAEVVQRGYFTVSPERTRDRWRAGVRAFLILLGVVGFFGIAVLFSLSAFAIVPVLALVVLAAVLWIVSPHLPRKTLAGAEAAARWEAFRTYLTDIEKYDRLSESREIFEKYLPYAVAFGLERSWVSKFAAAGAQTPAWYGPVLLPRPRVWTQPRPSSGGGDVWSFPTGGGGWEPSGRSGRSGGGFDFPDLQSSSDRAGRSLQGTSDSIFSMLNSASRAFSSYSGGSSSRRHWGSTGGRRSGGGFRGGGRSRGSSGGGRRGFR